MIKKIIILAVIVIGALSMLGFIGPYLSARKIIRPPIGATLTVPAFAYAPSPHQTDSTPCLTASGVRVRRGTLAANFLPFGTIVKINSQHYIVEDRMHPRYDRAVDILMASTSEARTFGRQTVTLTVVAYGKPGQKLFPLPAGVKRAEAEPQALWQQWQGGVNYLQRLLRAGAPTDVNRYDVSCFEE